MDWNLKSSPWDLTKFEHEGVSNMDALDGSSSYGGPATKGGFSVDLKLGQVGNPEKESAVNWKEPGISKLESSPSGSSKRARGANNGNQTVSCLVDGCSSDLSNCRDYHRRHKVCELHSKTPQVLINGQRQRFCQQCSRFHSLEEFDEGKRSCRKRLDGHNRRRRKPQPDPISRAGNFLSNLQGTHLLSFSSSHVYPTTAVVNPAWAGVVTSEANFRQYNQHQHQQLHSPEKQNMFLGSSLSGFKGGKQYAFLQADDTTLNNQTSPEASICQPLFRTIALSESGGVSHNMFSDRLTTRLPDSDCALSLLSSPQTQTSGIGLSHMLQHNSVPPVQPLSSSMYNHSSGPVDSVLVSNDRDPTVHQPGMFHVSSGGSMGNEAPQTLPYYWE